MTDNDRISSSAPQNQNIHLLSEFLIVQTLQESEFQDDQQIGGHVKETQKSQGSVLQKTETPPIADISQVPI